MKGLKIIGVLCSYALLAGCGHGTPDPALQSRGAAAPEVTELVTTDVVVGTGSAVAQGQDAVAHYTGWLYDPGAADNKGKQFDSSRERGVPFRFNVGAGKVIKGWDKGVVGMQVGGQRRLVVPAYLAYGNRGGGRIIPPRATLLFDVELLAIE